MSGSCVLVVIKTIKDSAISIVTKEEGDPKVIVPQFSNFQIWIVYKIWTFKFFAN